VIFDLLRNFFHEPEILVFRSSVRKTIFIHSLSEKEKKWCNKKVEDIHRCLFRNSFDDGSLPNNILSTSVVISKILEILFNPGVEILVFYLFYPPSGNFPP
jgi:hypothetical protein